MKKRVTPGALPAVWIIILLLLPIIVSIVAIGIGRVYIPPFDVIRSVVGKFTGQAALSGQFEIVLWSIRFPRILLALLVGAGLSVAGCTFQSLFSNPLATPDTVGVASGASFGAVLGLLFGFSLIGVQLTALAFGIAAVALTYFSVAGKRASLNSIVLAGIMISALFSALISLIKFVADPESELPSITYWLMGGLDSAGYASLFLGAPPILIGIIILFLLRWRLNLLPLSEDEAKASGTNIILLRVVAVVCATAITASSVAMCGQVGWVGLLIPHICRMKFGSNHTAVLPASISLGAAFMVIVDTACRSMTTSEIPISILTAIIGAPFFIGLMRRSGGWQI